MTLAKHQLSVSNPNTPPESACLSLWTILPAWFSEASESTCVKPIERHLPQLYLPFMNSSPWEFFPVGCCPFHSSGYLENRDNYPPPNPVNDQVFQARVTSSDHSLCWLFPQMTSSQEIFHPHFTLIMPWIFTSDKDTTAAKGQWERPCLQTFLERQ